MVGNIIKIVIFIIMAGFGVITKVEGRTVPSCHYFINNSALKNSAMKKEIWKDAVGYEGLYQVSNLGKVKSLKRSRKARNNSIANLPEKIIGDVVPSGYIFVSLSKKAIQKTFGIHRVVAMAFLPNPNNYKCVNHKNGIKTDNRVENLEWCTYSYNAKHACRNGLKKVSRAWFDKKGAEHPRSRPIIQMTKDGDFVAEFDSMTEADEKTGISFKYISMCCLGKRKVTCGFKWKYKE